MKTSSKIVLLLGLLLVIAGGFLAVGNLAKTDENPDILIQQTLHDAAEAARNGSTNGVMETISENFNVGNINKARLRLLLSRTLSQARGVDYEVHINAPRILPSARGNPDERQVITKFAAFYAGGGGDIYNGAPVQLIMRKEMQRKWLFWREPRWRIVGVVGAIPILSGEEV